LSVGAITPGRRRRFAASPRVVSFLALLATSSCASLLPWRSAPRVVAFTDKVWRVERPSDIAVGAFYIFLSDGTLIIKAPQAPPLVGAWSFEAGVFTMVEEGIAYQIDVLALRPDEFLIRSRNPGPPVLVRLVPADTPPEPGDSETR
jgi:hypothetical protein